MSDLSHQLILRSLSKMIEGSSLSPEHFEIVGSVLRYKPLPQIGGIDLSGTILDKSLNDFCLHILSPYLARVARLQSLVDDLVLLGAMSR